MSEFWWLILGRFAVNKRAIKMNESIAEPVSWSWQHFSIAHVVFVCFCVLHSILIT